MQLKVTVKDASGNPIPEAPFVLPAATVTIAGAKSIPLRTVTICKAS